MRYSRFFVFLIAIALLGFAISACGGQPSSAPKSNPTAALTQSQPIQPPSVQSTTAPTAQPTQATKGLGRSAHLTYQVELNGAATVKGTFGIDPGNDMSCVPRTLLVISAVPIQKIGGTDFTVNLAPAAINVMNTGGTYTLSKEFDIVLSIGDMNFTSGGGGTATVTMNTDGSGKLTFNNPKDVASSKKENGTVSWTCQ